MRSYLGIDIEYVDLEIKFDFLDLEKVKSQHITLHFWEDITDVEARRISKKLRTYHHESFAVNASKVYAFPDKVRPHLVALQLNSSEALTELRNSILLFLNLKLVNKFEPHITLYRRQKLNSSFNKTKTFLRNASEIKVQISNVALYSSEPKKGLNEYKLLEKIKLD